MTEDAPDAPSIPIDPWPDPICHYAMAGETPVVEGVNDAFEATFGPVPEGESVIATLGGVDLSPRDPATDPASVCAAGGRLVVESSDPTRASAGADAYVLRAVPPDAGRPGYLVLVPLPHDATTDDRSSDGTPDDQPGQLDLDHVASVISHDLRNPLDVATARLRAGRELDDDEHLEHVARAHDRMGRIIDDVLTFARGTEVVQPDETVDLGTAATAAWDTVETDAATLDLRDPLPTTVADSDRVRRLFENLFRNAVEHTRLDDPSVADAPEAAAGDDRRRDVTVTVGRLDADATDGFFVADDGPGIPAGCRDRVFEPGYTADDHGTGLGLAIVDRIATLHGWSVDAATATTGGARFEVHGVDPV